MCKLRELPWVSWELEYISHFRGNGIKNGNDRVGMRGNGTSALLENSQITKGLYYTNVQCLAICCPVCTVSTINCLSQIDMQCVDMRGIV